MRLYYYCQFPTAHFRPFTSAGPCRRRPRHLARHGQGWQDRRGARPRPRADRHPDQSGGAARRQRHLGTGDRDGPGHRGGQDTLTNRVKVQTQAGQVIELDTAAKDRQIGEQVTLIVPR
jgi:hypothetical protein